MNKANQGITVKVRDRVTFDTDEGIQAGYVNDLRRDLGNGELHAWIELEHHLPGCFRAVPASDILTSDQVGPPSTIYTDVAWTKFEQAAAASVRTDDIAQRLARAERALFAHGFIDRGGDEWEPPVDYRPIEVIDAEEYFFAHQSGLDDARSGEHELFPDENYPIDALEGDKPLCRFHFFTDSGDSSVGEPGRSYWALSADQSGTELAQILATSARAMTDAQAVEFADRNAVVVENAYVAYTGEHLDHGAAYAIAEAMAAAHI
jgi:hypothetical protein